ncbi:MAG: NAD(P)H-binding protein [Rubrobacteraceae bacterium]
MLDLVKKETTMQDEPTTFPSRPRLIAVLGGTGTVGSEVMRQLSNYDCAVRGVLRAPDRTYPVAVQERPARVGYVTSDVGSPDHLRRAFAGADAVFLLTGTSPDQVQTETRAIEAARQAGVRRVVKLSAPVVGGSASVQVADWHREIEERLAASGLEYCFLRPYSFMQNWLRNAHTIKHSGKIIGSAGSSPRNYVDCRDVAEIATRLLLDEKPPGFQGITLTGPEVITNQDMAGRLSLVTGSVVEYEDISRDEHYHMLLSQAKLPEWLARHIVELEELATLIPEQPTDTVQNLLGRYPRTMDEFLQEHRSAFLKEPAR